MLPKILIVEDELKTARSIQKGLIENNFEADIAENGKIGWEMADNTNYDLVISDIILPEMNGIEVCLNIRQKQPDTPVLLLTALGSLDDKITGFDSGADDYLVKPFEFKELLARVKVLLKRKRRNHENKKISFADLTLDIDSKSVFRNGKTIELTAREFALMEYFILNPNRVISKAEIAEKVWDIHFDTGTNVIEVYVNYLRNKIDRKFQQKLIHTAHGMGYILKES